MDVRLSDSACLVLGALGALIYGLLIARVASRLADREDATRILSRKLFHVGIFTGAAPAQLVLGFWGVMGYGGMIALLVVMAVYRGRGSGLARALTRSSEPGSGRREVVLPLVSTALGGLLSLMLVGSFAVVGYLVCGWGDAAGEAVGVRLGRRRFVSPLARSRPTWRTLEGSVGVAVVGALGGWAALSLLGFGVLPALAVGAGSGLVGAIAEGLSPPGSDNLWVQVAPSLLAWGLLG